MVFVAVRDWLVIRYLSPSGTGWWHGIYRRQGLAGGTVFVAVTDWPAQYLVAISHWPVQYLVAVKDWPVQYLGVFRDWSIESFNNRLCQEYIEQSPSGTHRQTRVGDITTKLGR